MNGGGAAGYGMDTALGCDIRIMAESAKMAAAFVKRGVVNWRHLVPATHDRLGESVGADLHRPRSLSARNAWNGHRNEVVPDAEPMVAPESWRARSPAMRRLPCRPPSA